MRGIKFKAYIYDLTDENSHPLEIDIRAGKIWDVASINFKDQIVEIMDDDGSVWEYELNDEIALMQYTGANDKNGVEIWTGHIVKFVSRLDDSKRIGAVRYWVGDAAFLIECEREMFFLFHDALNREVIGNIYENPEILKDK